MTGPDDALVELLRALRAADYDFVTPSPLTHARVLARLAGAPGETPRDIFGWNRPFAPARLDAAMLAVLQRADALAPCGDLVTCRYRVARCGDRLFLHSPFPTLDADSVFFGPDSYRFARFIAHETMGLGPFATILDIGAGSGVGALSLAARIPDAALRLVDLNAAALRLARINARAADLDASIEPANGVDATWTAPTLVIANPPYMADDKGRLYRDGGAMRGAAVSLQWARAVIARLRPGDAFLLYTGVAIVAGHDPLRAALQELSVAAGCGMRYDEIDPDVWGEELSRRDFADVDRIAVVGAVVQR